MCIFMTKRHLQPTYRVVKGLAMNSIPKHTERGKNGDLLLSDITMKTNTQTSRRISPVRVHISPVRVHISCGQKSTFTSSKRKKFTKELNQNIAISYGAYA